MVCHVLPVKRIGAISVGQWLGWAIAAWQEGAFRKIEVWADKSGTGSSWHQTCIRS